MLVIINYIQFLFNSYWIIRYVFLVVFYIKFIKKRILIGNNKDVKDGNVPFINIDKIKEAITI